MSSRSKKRTQQTTHQESVTQSTPSTSRSPGRSRPPSPTTITRQHEKNELANLNDRLASYIDRVRYLENENTRLSRVIQTQEETVTRETSGIKAMYVGELKDARRLLDETAKEKAKIQLELNAALADCKDYKDKYFAVKRELEGKDRRLLNAETQVAELQARVTEAVNQRKHWEGEYHKLKKELDALALQLANAKKQLEEETLQRVHLQNRVQTLKEELAFKASVHDKELNETRTRSTIELEEVDAHYADEFESRLKEEIQAMRAENDAVVESARADAAEFFEKKLAELTTASMRGSDDLDFARSELRNARIRLDELTTEVDKLNSQNSSLEARVRDLVNQLRRQQDEHEAAMSRKDADIRGLKTQLEEQLSEYRDLLSIKIQLDNEIATYNRLLEAEESRLNISQSSQSTAASPFAQRSVRRTVSGKKRKRGDMEGSFMSQSASSSWAQAASCSGPIEVYETDTDGKFVKLYNTSDEDVSLAGWKLQHTSGDEETLFKFHRTLVIKAKEHCTVWSSDSGTEHNPPADLVMKGKRFFTGDSMKTVLLNSDGAEQASRELTKSIMRTQYITSSREADVDSGFEVGPRQALFYRQGEEAQKEKCAIM